MSSGTCYAGYAKAKLPGLQQCAPHACMHAGMPDFLSYCMIGHASA